MYLRFALSTLLALALLGQPGPAAAQRGPFVPAMLVAGTVVKLPVKAGDCVLDRSNPADRRVIELLESLLAETNELHLLITRCRDLEGWRAGHVPTLDSLVEVLTPRAYQRQNFAGHEKIIISSVCNAYRRSTEDHEQAPDALPFIDQARNHVEDKLVHVLGEDENGCYVRLTSKDRLDRTQEKSRLSVGTTAVLNGKVVYIYHHWDDAAEQGETERVLVELKAMAKTYVEANGGHKK